MKKLPSKIKIGGMDYKVLYPYEFEDDSSVSTGLHEAGTNLIKISEYEDGIKRHPHKILETFIHEIVHAVDFVYVKYELSEKFVTVFSKGLTGVLLNNNLKLSERGYQLVKKVKIGGYEYKVIYPYKFRDTGSFLTSDLNNATFIIRIAKEDFDSTYIKANLLYCVSVGIFSTYFFNSVEDEYEDCEINWKSFSQGLFQVIVDNKLEKLFDDWRVR